MKRIALSRDEKAALEKRHEGSRDRRICDRIKAVLLSNEGWSTAQIAQALRLHETSVLRHIGDYLEKGKLKPENGGSNGYLSQVQGEELVAYLTEHTHRCAQQIIDYIRNTYQVDFSVPGLNKWLHKYHFSYRKPKGIPHKFDAQQQAEFISKYRALKAQVTDEPILFMDAVHPTQATKLSAGWIRKGDDKAIQTTGSRTRLNIVGAVDLNALSDAVIRRYESVNSESIATFLVDLRSHYTPLQRLRLILDGAGYHRAELVKRTAKELNIELHYLPPYSPNLNPIERLWKVMNEHVRNNRYFATAKEFRERIDAFFKQTLPEIGNALASRINDNFQILHHPP